MARFSGERLVRTRDDPDLGRLELWSWPRPRGLLEFAKPQEDYLEWRGASGGLPFFFGVDVGVDPETQLLFLDADARTTISSLAEREPLLRRETAKREVGLAREWADNDLLNEDEFAESLHASEIAIYADANNLSVDLYFEDTMNIFAGHIVMTSLDKSGAIVTTGIEG